MKLLQLLSVTGVLLLMAFQACAMPKPSSEPMRGQGAHESVAVFAGGCFWCMEKPFDQLNGVISTTSGYIGGHVLKPTYKQVSAGGSGHYEAVKIVYNPKLVSYKNLLQVFWVNVDPVDGRGQFCDKGSQYLSAIFVADANERKIAEDSLQAREEMGSVSGEVRAGTIKTEVLQTAVFYPAEKYHQDYYQKNPIRYRYYRGGCGRDKRLKELWGEQK